MRQLRKENGFTLAEVLGVIVILSVLVIILIPPIANQIIKSKNEISKATLQLIYSATESYMTKKQNEYPIYNGNVYCIQLQDLVDNNELKAPIKDIKIGKEIDLANVVKVSITNIANIDYEIIKSENCEAIDRRFPALKLVEGMIPIYWDSNNVVRKADINNAEGAHQWYDYDEQMWANAVLVTDAKRVEYKSAAPGTVIDEQNVLAYWVWIPRYGYKIKSGYHSSSTGTIDVKFLNGVGNSTNDGTTVESSGYKAGENDTSMKYFVHPAFQNDINKYGFWVAKFEPTAAEGLSSGITDGSCNSADNVTTKTVKIVPNVTSWRCINIKNAYTVSLNMRNKTDVYGWKSEEVDTHMMTNHEWGAIAYLSKSQYGAPGEVWNNAYNEYKTGCSGTGVNSLNLSTCIEYNTENGVKASTTHNIYGVYDMSGGSWERVMGNYNNLVGSSGFTADEVRQIDSKYITRYETPSNEMLNGIGMDYDARVYGDGVYETSNGANRYKGNGEWEGISNGSWYRDYSYLPYLSYPWLNRGGYWILGSYAGVFYFSGSDGSASVYSSFRPVLAPMK